MNDAAIKNFCSFAREQLTRGVELCMAKYGVTPEADAAEQLDAVAGVPLSPQERAQRADLLRQRDALGAGDAARGWARLRDKAAYTWFNRIVAIRFMELRDYLPSRARMFSDEAGALGSQALDQALDVEIGDMDPARVVELKQAGDDEVLASIYFSPFSPTYFRQSRQRGCAGFANADAPLPASRRPPPSRPHRRWIRPSGDMTVPLS
ncbi:hypothetical protein ET524_02380 [Senegalimassilia faecalis]|uniref:Uncharacterized protein n=1 Tax=Senegalimassilia faecalis TaxID=2509433 RepID=A0A4Q2JZE4_9ACTN|nr:hypothetical protein [Senegalimassilia faecalis]RXZ53458.1 hypothetical protein ET524_02380 [Senegalimassilia faecalis]